MNVVEREGNALQSILFVDDDIRILKGVKRLFHQNRVSWQTTFASGVDEALDVIMTQKVDAVISDIKMPGKDGFDLLSILRASPEKHDLPVVMLTGLDRGGLKNRALDLGATDLLNKPVDPEELFARIRSMLHLKKCQDMIKQQNAHLEELVHKRTKILEATRLDVIWRLGKVVEYRSDETGNHVIRVGFYSKVLAETLGMNRAFTETIFLTSPLHDIGKIGIPDTILQKPGKLDAEEWEIMKGHCELGRQILGSDASLQKLGFDSQLRMIKEVLAEENNPFLVMARDIAACHHEQWLGGGYPAGLSGEQIPLSARIVGIVDIYDALCSRRSYKEPWSHEKAVELMTMEKDTRFDPEVFNAFFSCRRKIREIHELYSRGEL